ncbi:MAG: hypothetical protein ABS920_10685, partial [Sporosarcina sp.]
EGVCKLKNASSVKEFHKIVESISPIDNPGTIYINQDTRIADKTILLDEDSSGSNAMQVLTIFLQTKKGAVLYEYPFSEPTELEEINQQMEEVYNYYPKRVIDAQAMARKIETSR